MVDVGRRVEPAANSEHQQQARKQPASATAACRTHGQVAEVALDVARLVAVDAHQGSRGQRQTNGQRAQLAGLGFRQQRRRVQLAVVVRWQLGDVSVSHGGRVARRHALVVGELLLVGCIVHARHLEHLVVLGRGWAEDAQVPTGHAHTSAAWHHGRVAQTVAGGVGQRRPA